MEVLRNVYRILVSKDEGVRPLGRYGHKTQDNIKVGLKQYERVE
jgi:hypothetical protein